MGIFHGYVSLQECIFVFWFKKFHFSPSRRLFLTPPPPQTRPEIIGGVTVSADQEAEMTQKKIQTNWEEYIV